MATIENQRGFDIDVVSEILSLTENIYETFINANFEAKRHYLSIFFEKIEVKDREIVKVTYTPLFKRLLETQNLNRVRANLLPIPKINITKVLDILQDLKYIGMVKERWEEIKRLQVKPALAYR